MKVSELNLQTIASHLNEVSESLTNEDKALIEMMQEAAVAYCADYTGLTREELDEHEDITIAVLALVSDMYDNRQTVIDRAYENKIVSTILGLHSINLL